MKKSISILALLFAALFMTSCNSSLKKDAKRMAEIVCEGGRIVSGTQLIDGQFNDKNSAEIKEIRSRHGKDGPEFQQAVVKELNQMIERGDCVAIQGGHPW